MRVVFNYNGDNATEFEREYASLIREEFYDGEMRLDRAPHLNVKIEKAISRPMALMRMRLNCGISFRRSWSHIRAKNIGVRVIWFVQKGSLKLARSRHSCTVNAGEVCILDSTQPFFAHAFVDGDGAFEAVQAVVPAHLFLTHLPSAIDFDRPFTLCSTSKCVVSKLMDILFGEGDLLSPSAVSPLAVAFLESLADDIGRQNVNSGRRPSVVDKRLADIEAYVMKNLTDPDLSYDEAAAKCGISSRYLCYVMRANNTSFSTLLWGQRLAKAHEWLRSPALQDHPIHEIALMAGFKSATHFSRMFKSRYGCSPRVFRASADQDANSGEAQQNDGALADNAMGFGRELQAA